MNDETIFAFRRNVIVAASAGTGKTFRLVSLYTLLTLGITSMGERDDRLAAPPISPELIGATTFSRSAAAEIRVRVERLFDAVSTSTFPPDLEPYARVLARRAAHTGQPAIDSDVMRERARGALAQLPYALIDTLHGLAARIIRSSAFEIGLAPSFSVVDEDEGRRELALAVDEALTAALERGDGGARALLEAAGGLGRAREQIARLLERLDEEGLSIGELEVRDAVPDAAELAAQVLDCIDLLAREPGPLAAPAVHAAREIRRWTLGGDPWSPANDVRAEPDEASLGAASRALADAIWPLIAGRSSPKDAAPLQALRTWFNDSIKASAPTKRDKVERFAELMVHAPGLRDRTLGARQVLEDAVRKLEQKRRHAGRLGFGDMLRIARDAVRDDPRVAARARESFPVLLVDEFQDTSRVQRDLIYLLRERDERARERPERTLPGASDLKTHGLLLVGDRKQSIYGFRGADVTVFSRVCAELAGEQARRSLGVTIDDPGHVPGGPEIADLVPLAENRRSVPEILAFVNQFADRDFGGAAGKKSYDLGYAEAEHLRPPTPDPAAQQSPALAIHGAPRSPRVLVVQDEPTRAHPMSPPELRFAKGELREAFVAALVAHGITRENDDLPLSGCAFGEVAILTRRRQFLPLLEYALDRLKLPFILAGRALFSTREAHDLSAVLRMLVDRGDRHALATVLRGPAFGMSDTALLLLSEPGRGLLQPYRWFSEGEGGAGTPAERVPSPERERLASIAERIAEIRRIAARLGAADALRYAVRSLEIDSVMAALPRGAQRLGNIDRIVSMASDQGGSLSAFSRWLDAKIADETDETEATVTDDGDDAVRLLTIHASKGLEWKAVVALDLAWTPRTVPHAIAMTRSGARPGLMVRPRTFEGAPLFLPEYAAHLAEEKGRDLAERKRLTYVAFTRARELLVLVSPDREDQARGSALETLRSLPEDEARSHDGQTVLVGGAAVQPVSAWLDRRTAEAPIATMGGTAAQTAAPPQNQETPRRPRSLTVATTPLSTFATCPRRYELLHLLELDEPPPGGGVRRGGAELGASPFDARPAPGDPRDLGTTAHTWLERFPVAGWGEPLAAERIASELRALAPAAASGDLERAAKGIARFVGGRYAERVAAEGAVSRELVFVMPLEGGASGGGARSAPRYTLRGAIDLLVRWPDGSTDVIDYKLTSRKEVEPYAFQLRTYALAAVRRLGAQRVRAGIIFLDGEAETADPVFLEPAPHVLALAAFEAELGELGRRLVEARWADKFDGIAVDKCRKLQCGFIGSCHPSRG